MKSLSELKAAMLQEPAVKAEYDALAQEFDTARELIAARGRAGVTQLELARRMGTTQSAIARLESGKCIPSIKTVQRYAQAIGCRAVVRLEPAIQAI